MNPMRSLACVSLLLLGGCAEERAFQKLTNLTAKSTVDFKTSAAAYVENANELRRTAADGNQTLDDLARGRAFEAARLRQTWKAAGDPLSKAALQAFDAATAFGRDPTLTEPALPLFGRAAPAVTVLKFDGAAYDGLVKQLTALAKPPSLQEEASFLLGYAKQVDDAYNKDMADTAAGAAAATEAGAAAKAATAKP